MRRLACWILVAATVGCETNPVTGRQPLKLVKDITERQLGLTSDQQALGESPVSTDPKEVEPVTRVGRRLAGAAVESDMQWEFNVIADDGTKNTWCPPGVKIAFNTGISDLKSRMAEATALYERNARAPVGNREARGGQVGTGFIPGCAAKVSAGAAGRAAAEGGFPGLRAHSHDSALPFLPGNQRAFPPPRRPRPPSAGV